MTADAASLLVSLTTKLQKLRRVSGDSTLHHAVKAGKAQLQRVTYEPGRASSTVTPLSDFQSINEHLRLLDQLIREYDR